MATTTLAAHLRAPRALVYRALIDPAAIATWRFPRGMRCEVHHLEPREGGTFRVSLTYDDPARAGKSGGHTDTYSGHYVALVPDERVVEALAFETADPAMAGTMMIAITLADAPTAAPRSRPRTRACPRAWPPPTTSSAGAKRWPAWPAGSRASPTLNPLLVVTAPTPC